MDRPTSAHQMVANRDGVAAAPEPVAIGAPSSAEVPPGQRKCRSRLITAGNISLVIGLLALHFAARWHHAQTMPLADRHNYERAYIYSLSVLAGRGFHDWPLAESSEAAPIARFLAKQSDQITDEEFAEFQRSSSPTDRDDGMDDHDRWASSRILDHYVIAGLWRLFGIRWDIVFLFGVAMSTVTCLFIFLLGRRLGGSYWAGLASGILFFAAPLASYLETWSLRDSSPLWFAAAGFWFLFCVVDRVPPLSSRRQLTACAGLGFVAMVGAGWRPDVFVSALLLGLSMVVLFRLHGMQWRRILASVAMFGVSAWACHTAILALTTEPVVDSQNGFHMAAYADFSRANLLKIENSFQIHRCDRETLFVARQYEKSHHPDPPPLPYIGSRYSTICRAMFLDEFRYNAFQWAIKFPAVYWKALNGLIVPGAFETLDRDQLHQARLPSLQWAYRTVLDPITDRLPWLFVLGVLVATAFGSARPQAALLAAFSVLQAAALLLVLPEQKHLAAMQLPLCVLGGIGLWTIAKLLCPSNWPRFVQFVGWRPSRAWLAIALALALSWGTICGVAYFVSVRERQNLIGDIEAAARDATPAPETLHGDRVFSVHILPGSAADSTGYLLRIVAGADPGALLCRHIHFPQDWCWPRVLETTHRLNPGREQFFFVTCLQGSEIGDPRPYSCFVTLDGDAHIVSASRVDLKHWQRLQVSTVFYEGQTSPGSPRVAAESSVMRWPNWPAIRWLADDAATLKRMAHDAIYVGPQPLPAPSQPLEHLIARDESTGLWQIAVCDGRRFQPAILNYWAPREWSFLATGNFNGDGLTDFVGCCTDGSWWLGRANGNNVEFKPCDVGLAGIKLDYLGVGDFNGDGIDDIAVRSAGDNQWWIGISDGSRFSFHAWGQSSPSVPPEQVRIADFNGDGRADIAEFNPRTGDWIVSLSDGARLNKSNWGSWDSAVARRHLFTADFSGDGRTDVAAWNPCSGQWEVGVSDGKRFDFRRAGNWPADVDWQHVQTGRFGKDGRRGIIGLDKKSQRLAIAEFDGQRFTTRYLPTHEALDDHLFVGRFSGGDRDDIAGLTKNHDIWVGTLEGDSIRYDKWGAWPDAERLVDYRVIGFWR
jgi:hypothetical protein